MARRVQPLNAIAAIASRVLGSSSDVRPVQPSNAAYSIASRVLGSSSDVRPVHPAKEYWPTETTPSDTATDWSRVQPRNASRSTIEGLGLEASLYFTGEPSRFWPSSTSMPVTKMWVASGHSAHVLQTVRDTLTAE